VADLVSVRLDWDRTAIPLRLPGFHVIHLAPEPSHPFGRKGLALAGAWRQLAQNSPDGMLILDGDVAIDLLDLAAMRAAIHVEPSAVHTAPVRLWPASMHGDSWVWSHWTGQPSQDDQPAPVRFSFCFTYIPARLIDSAVKAGLESWSFPHVDRLLSLHAKKTGIPVRIVAGCTPKHLHF
jgi:hypothetical protein